MISLFLVIGLSLGLATLGFMCKHRLKSLNLCQLVTYTVLAPAMEMFLIVVLIGIGSAIIDNWMMVLGQTIFSISIFAAIVTAIILSCIAFEKASKFCPIIWKKK